MNLVNCQVMPTPKYFHGINLGIPEAGEVKENEELLR